MFTSTFAQFYDHVLSIETISCVKQSNMHDATTFHAPPIVLQFNCIENESYIVLGIIFASQSLICLQLMINVVGIYKKNDAI